MKKLFYLALAAMVVVGCSKGSSSQEATSQEVTQEVEEEEPSFLHEPEDTRPPIVMEGEGYRLELPAFAEDVQCEPISDEEEEELRSQGYAFVVKPLNVTRNGENHVQLGQPATVCFAIPEDFPKEQYNELVGVLITDDGPEYKIPDYYALREGYIKFQTSHFTIASAEQKQYELREKFIEEVAVYGWGRNMSNKDMEPTMRAQINKFAEDFCLGENDLVGIAMREVFGEKDFVKIGLDIVNAYDMENASLEQRMAVASETMIKLAKGKVLSYFIKKLKTDENKKVKVLDEIKSEKKGVAVYKKELANIDSRRDKVIGVLEDHFKMENAEKVGTTLGSNPTFEECYILAWQYITEFAKEKTKDALIEMIPYLGYMKQMATAVEIWKKFWAATQMQDLYKTYEKKANAKGALLDEGEWTEISLYVNAPEFLHGMTDRQMREYIEERFLEKMEIERRKEELREYIAMIEKSVDLKSECFEQKHFDYVQRLTVVRNLMERFYDELVGDDGYLTYIDNGYRQAICSPNAINQQLCYVVDEYLNCYPDREKFYVWLDENGYDYGQLEDEYNRLDKLLWHEEPVKDPDVHIVIREVLGASGSAKYVGYLICLGKDGVPSDGWARDIPDEDSLRDGGWSTEFPDEGEYMKLSEYDAIGRPNQVMIYKRMQDIWDKKAPVESFTFEVDTMNRTTYVEINSNDDGIREYVLCEENRLAIGKHRGNAIGYVSCHYDEKTGMEEYLPREPHSLYPALKAALRDVSFYLNSQSDFFSFTTSGEGTFQGYGNSIETTNIEISVTGEVDFKKKSGTCTITATATCEDLTIHYPHFTGEIEVSTRGKVRYIDGHAEGKVKLEWREDGKVKKHTTEGSIGFSFRSVEED